MIPIRMMMLLLRKSSIEATFPGGMEAFRRWRDGLAEDSQLVAITSMSSACVQQDLDVLRAMGFDVENGCAVADMMIGPMKECRGIELRRPGMQFFGGWEAIAREEPR